MSDYSDIISHSFGQQNPALPQAVGNIDEDPDKAQRALDLAKATGVPSTAIYGDLDEFERQHKAMLASDIVANNPHLGDFVQSNPMIPKIANDDYGNLDSVSQKVSGMSLPMRIFRAPEAMADTLFDGDPLKRFKEGGPLGSWLRDEDLKNHPIASAIAAGLGTPIELFFRGIGGTIETAADVAANAGKMVGAPGLGRELGAVVESEAMGLTGRTPVHGPAVEAYQRVRPYLENGREPLPTVLPEYDQYRAKQNADDVAALKEATSEAQQSLTRERSPDLFRQFINQHTDAEIGVSGDAVAALYGDKVPSADDGLLGWVPNIESKLNLARASGDDISIPLSDWLTHVADNPDVMKALEDDIRVRPGGITANEAKLGKEAEAASPAAVPIPEEVPTVRAATGLEPLLSVGDRKLKLERLTADKTGRDVAEAEGVDWSILNPTEQQGYNNSAHDINTNKMFGPEQGFHDFSMNDEKGNPVGTINLSEQKGGKQLYVEMINGVNGLGPRDFGPALMRDLLRQIKQEFPNAETITGHRVSGAREKAGVEMTAAAPVVKLDDPGLRDFANVHKFQQALQEQHWARVADGLSANVKPSETYTAHEQQIVAAVHEELQRIVPQYVEPRVVAGLRGSEDLRPIHGAYIPQTDRLPMLLYSLTSDSPLATARHEAIHHLRQYGFFKEGEWETLQNAALAEGWLKKYGIDNKYPEATPSLKLEESIAEAYQDWAGRRDNLAERAKQVRGVKSPIDAVFQKLHEFLQALKQRFAIILGHEPSWEELFESTSAGEIGGREGTQPILEGAFKPLMQEAEERDVFARANALGMSKEQYQRYSDLIQKRHGEDIEAATKRAMEERGREQTKQWREDRKVLRAEVSESIKQRPDVAADLFLGAQELYGHKLSDPVKLKSSELTDEQKALLPRKYYGEDGMHPDAMANIFGYGSGDAMVSKLTQYNAAKMAAGMSAKDFVSRVTDIETDRQMRIKYGVLEDNIMDAVKEQVVGETQLDILAEETHALGMKVGQAPLDKATIVDAVRQEFAKSTLSSVSSDRYLASAGRAGKAAEMALLNDDPATAFQAKQRQFYATVLAREAVQLEKDLGRFDKLAKRFSKREVSAIDQEYTNFIHDILMRVGKPVRRSIQDLETEIAAGEYHSLQEFVEGKNGFYLREVAVADQLFNPNFRKKFDDLTVDEFNGVNTSVKSMLVNGRDEKKITKAGVEADLSVVRNQMIDQLKQFQERTYDAKGGRWMGPIPPKIAKVLRSYGTAHIQMENLFNRWDHDNPQGVFQQYIMRDLVDASNNESVMEKRYAEKLRGLDDKADLKKLVDNPIFKVPNSDQLMQFNRGNLRTILLNAGNSSNLAKLAKGYKLTPEQVMGWLHQHATKKDWDWGQKMGDVFKELKAEADVMYRNISGVAPESLPIRPVDTPHGQYPGWYYPVIYHPEFEGPSRKLMGKDALEQEGFVRATTANGYTQKRTGYAGPMALDLDMLPARMKQMVHDVAMRPSVINASKIFYDKDVRGAISKHFGNEWRDMLVPYLVDVANSANYVPKAQRQFMQASEFIRQNIVSTLVGLNPGTAMKHGPTALVQSLHEVGTVNFLKAMKGLFSVNERTGESNWQFAMKESEELQRRHQNYVETLGGATDMLQPRDGFASLRSTVQRFSATPVAISDLLSAVPTWLAQYEKSMADNGGVHGDAVYDANRAVRRAHGSVAITNRSAVMRGGALSQWFASVYGFFNHIMNRQYELLWKSGEMLGQVKDGQYREAMQKAPELTSMLFAYVLAPALIEELVTPLISSDNESWGKKAAKGLAFTLGASWVGVRDIASAMLNGRDPSVGLISTVGKTMTDVARDLNKTGPFNKEHAGKVIKDGATLLGALTGVVPAQAGRTAEGIHGYLSGQERPKGPWGWLTLARYGTLKGHPATMNEWQRHHIGGH